jgi:hypothetical protein
MYIFLYIYTYVAPMKVTRILYHCIRTTHVRNSVIIIVHYNITRYVVHETCARSGGNFMKLAPRQLLQKQTSGGKSRTLSALCKSDISVIQWRNTLNVSTRPILHTQKKQIVHIFSLNFNKMLSIIVTQLI